MQDGLSFEFSRAHSAAWNNNVETLKQEGNYNFPDKAGNYPIHLACENRATRVIEFLLENGVSVNQRNSKNGRTPLHIAAVFGDIMLINILAQQGAELNAIAGNGETPMALAERAGHSKAASYLCGLQRIETLPDNRMLTPDRQNHPSL